MILPSNLIYLNDVDKLWTLGIEGSKWPKRQDHTLIILRMCLMLVNPRMLSTVVYLTCSHQNMQSIKLSQSTLTDLETASQLHTSLLHILDQIPRASGVPVLYF